MNFEFIILVSFGNENTQMAINTKTKIFHIPKTFVLFSEVSLQKQFYKNGSWISKVIQTSTLLRPSSL